MLWEQGRFLPGPACSIHQKAIRSSASFRAKAVNRLTGVASASRRSEIRQSQKRLKITRLLHDRPPARADPIESIQTDSPTCVSSEPESRLPSRRHPADIPKTDPEKVIFDTGTRLRVEANHWKAFSFVMAVIAVGAVYTRNPPPSVVRSYGVSSDANGHAVVTQLAAYKPDDQTIRTSVRESVEGWFTIEPVLTDNIKTSRMAHNINAVKAQMTGTASNQFGEWLKTDAPFQAITANPKLVREVKVTNVSILPDATAIVEFTTTSTQTPTDKPAIQKYALTVRYQILPPTQEDALGSNPYGIFFPFFTLQKTT